MIVLRDHFVDAYHVIRQDSCHMSPVVVFVAPDCDSVCACHMLTTLFRMDNVPYKVRPIANYEEMKSSCRASFSKRQDEDVQNVVLLNCGGSVNLTSFLELQENVILYVIDSHRPYHLANVSSENLQVRIIDESNEHNEYPSDDEIEEFSEEGETIEGWSPDEYSQKKRRKTSRSLREAKQQLIADYYQGSYFGQAASMILYSLAQQLSRDDNMLLWCAIVGLTDQFVHSRTQIDRYNEHVVELRHEVLSKNENSNQSDEPGSIDKGSPVINPGQVMFEANELIFFHYRHIALLDSIYHSKYVASRLGVWKDQGSKKLRTFLARMGIPLRECSLSYMVMKTLYKDSLREKLEIYSSEYGLDIDDLVFASFSRQYDTELQVSATDVVHSVSALLEYSTLHQASDPIVSEKTFWKAYDSIFNGPSIKEGIDISVKLQKEIVQRVRLLLVQRKIVCSSAFRYAVMDESSCLESLKHPLALIKLAHFLNESYQNQHKRGPKAFVLCNLNVSRQTYLVAGIPSPRSVRQVTLNSFGRSFIEAAERSGARIKHDGFEESIIEVQREDLNNFLHVLTLLAF